MDETWKEAFFQSFVFYENFSAMEKCARTRFFIPSVFRKSFWQWKKVAELAFHEPSDSTEPGSGWKLAAGREAIGFIARQS